MLWLTNGVANQIGEIMNQQSNLKTMVRGMYDIQKLRIQMGNRIVANFKAKLGQAPSESETTLDAEGKRILKTLRESHKKLTDGVKTFPRRKGFTGDEVISSHTELCLVEDYLNLEAQEAAHKRHIESTLEEFPIWTDFMWGVKGIGPAMAGVIISEIDITKAEYASSLWMYAGLDVAPDGQGRSRKAEHLVEVEYKDKEGETKTKKSITFNPFLKTKLIGVLASSFIRAGENTYEQIYRGYKNRIENMPAHAEKSKGHRDNMAKRYMVKQFLVDLYTVWREIEGLPVALPYSEAKLGIIHKKAS